MIPQRHDAPVDERLGSSTLRVKDNSTRVDNVWQMLSSFNHRCRNSLNGIKMSLYLYKREIVGPAPGYLLEIERTYQEMEVLFDRLQMIYRPLSLTVVRSPVGRLIDERLPMWRSWFVGRGRVLEFTRPVVELPGDFDPMQLGLGLDAFVSARAQAGQVAEKIHLSWGVADDYFEIRWDEEPAENGSPCHAHKNGRCDSALSNGKVDSLADPLLKRIVAAHGGLVETTFTPTFTVRVRWPRFQSHGPAN